MTINTKADFECLKQLYRYIVDIVIDDNASHLKFHFKSAQNEQERLPIPAREFVVITTFHRRVLFNRLASSKDELQESIRQRVNEFVTNFRHQDLPAPTGYY